MENQWNYEDLLASIHQTFDILARNENLIRAHQSINDNVSIIEQYEELKVRYTQDLLELLQQMNIPLKLSA